MLVCQDRECGHRKMYLVTTNARCPQCKKKLELRGEGAGQIFACKCGYREKLSTFQERRKKNLETKLINVTFKNMKQQQKKKKNH